MQKLKAVSFFSLFQINFQNFFCMDEFIDSLISSINQDDTKNISYSYQVYPNINKLVTTNPTENIIQNLGDRIENHFQDFIIEINSNQSFIPFMRYAIISKEFRRYKKITTNVFLIIQRYTDGCFLLKREIDQLFIRIFQSLTDFDELLLSFFEKLDAFHFTDFKLIPEFKDLVLVSKLIHFCYYNKNNENREIISNTLIKETEKSARSFIQKISESNPIEFINLVNQYLNTEESLLKELFYNQNVNESLTNIYNYFITVNSSISDSINDQIKDSCKKHDKSFIIDYYKFISFRSPTEDLLLSISETIHDQIKVESIESITDFGSSISFYNELFDSINNPFLTRKYNRQMIEFINNEKKTIFKELISFISNKALSNPDISPIMSILGKIESKNEFELIYTRHVTRRIVPPTEKQIEKEKSIVSQIKSSSSSSSFDFTNLMNLLKEASQSIERGIGSVLICHSSVWPFKPPFSNCTYFDSITTEIKEKYSKLNPCRNLTFPFDSWIVVVKDTVNNFFMSGNAVQAQVFLYLNNHEIVHKDSFSPSISSAQMTSVLKSLSSKKMQILVEKQDSNETIYFSINRNFKNKFHTLKLPIPTFVFKTVQKDMIEAKNNQIDAAATKLMKEKRMMNYSDFESEIIERLSDRFRVTPDEVKNRLNVLIAREFIEMNEEDNSLVYLP